MVEQLRNDDNMELIRGDYFARNEPNAAWSHTVSDHLMLPGLHCFWPTSKHHDDPMAILCCDAGGGGHDLTLNNTPLFQLWDRSLGPCIQFDAAASQYLSHADDPHFDITGTEAYILTAQRGLAMGLWVRWTDRTGVQGLISKWVSGGNQRAYRLYKDAAHNIVFEVSNAGAAVDGTVTSTGTVANDTWYHIVARFIPSRAMDVYINSVRTTNAAGITAAINSSTAAFEVGRTDGGSYLDGYTSLMWLASCTAWDFNTATRDVLPFALYEHSKRLWNK